LNSATVTYRSTWTDCDASTTWFLNQWNALAAKDQLAGLPVLFRQDVPWTLSLRKEDNEFRVVVHEKTADGTFVATPEDAL
jgi:hypothetical protein